MERLFDKPAQTDAAHLLAIMLMTTARSST
jgi:hypothetical protein